MASAHPFRRLLVIIPDQLTQIIDKGEMQPRYYNPGNLFAEVHIMMTNADRPPIEALRYLAGDAEVHIHNHPDDLTLPQRDWKRWWQRPLRKWAAAGAEIARWIEPDLIRCHGADWNTYLASRIRRKTGTPYAVSLHINADINPPRRHLGQTLTPEQCAHNEFYEYIEREGLRHADIVMPVYEPIVPYLKRLGIKRYEVCYNVLNREHLRKKDDYSVSPAPRILYVGRLIAEKNPANIIRAVGRIPAATLTIVGDGALRPELEALTTDLGLAGRVTFEPAVTNDALCERLPTYDLFAIHSEYWELSKSLLEALLTGLPAIVNRRTGDPVPELARTDIVHFVDNNPDGYYGAITTLLADQGQREDLGRRAYQYSQARWAPAVTETKVVDIYRRLVARRA